MSELLLLLILALIWIFTPDTYIGSKYRCNEVSRYGKKEARTGEHLTHFNNKINKHKWKAAAPHGRLPHTKHKLKFQAWSSLVFHCRHSSFNPSEAPPWDSRPVSGAGVVHYHLLHRPRSVPTRHNRLSVYLICNNRYRYRPWKTHIGRPLNLISVLCLIYYELNLWYKSDLSYKSNLFSKSDLCYRFDLI